MATRIGPVPGTWCTATPPRRRATRSSKGHPITSHSTYRFSFVTIEYRWHPFHGRRVHARDAGRRDGILLLVDGDPHVARKLPEWMCDPAVCRPMTLGPPLVAADALSELSDVLAVLLPNRTARTSSASPEMEAAGEPTHFTTASSTSPEPAIVGAGRAALGGVGASARRSSARSPGAGHGHGQREGGDQ